MKDFLLAVLGPRTCGWCELRGPWLYWRVTDFNTVTLRIWRLGRRWHDRFHPPR